MIARDSLFPILIFVTMNLTDVLGGVPFHSDQDSEEYPSPVTLDLPDPHHTVPEEMPYSLYTVFTQGPEEPVPQPAPELQPAPAYSARKYEPHPQRVQQSSRSHAAASDHPRESRLQRVDQPDSKLARGSKNESRIPASSGHHSESQSLSDKNLPRDHQGIPVVHNSQDPLLHPVPHRHHRKFRVRMPSRTPLNVRRLFTFLNLRITKKLLFENLHLVRKKTPAPAPAVVASR